MFEAAFMFTDVFGENYKGDDHYAFPVICTVFAPYKVKECRVQALLTYPENKFEYVDSDGNRWKL